MANYGITHNKHLLKVPRLVDDIQELIDIYMGLVPHHHVLELLSQMGNGEISVEEG